MNESESDNSNKSEDAIRLQQQGWIARLKTDRARLVEQILKIDLELKNLERHVVDDPHAATQGIERPVADSREWWELPGADEDRPMTPEQTVRYLQLHERELMDPVRTLLRWARDGKINCIRLGHNIRFNLRICREYATREQGKKRRRRAE